MKHFNAEPKKYFFSFSVFKRSLMLCCSIQISDVQWLLRTVLHSVLLFTPPVLKIFWRACYTICRNLAENLVIRSLIIIRAAVMR